jgi:uncharacterized membrane protein
MLESFSFITIVEFFLRWFHLLFGVMWIGHLYYFNMTQGAFLNSTEVDNSAKLAVRSKLLPVALWWFRHGAMWTVITGVLYWGLKAHLSGNFGMFLQSSSGWMITAGAILGLTMWYNVWFVIWPKQKIVIKNAEGVSKGQPPIAEAAAAGARANVASRTNTLWSIPMLLFMGASSHLPLPVTSTTNSCIFWIGFAILWIAIEYKALRGQTGKLLTTVKQVITNGFILSAIYAALIIFSL